MKDIYGKNNIFSGNDTDNGPGNHASGGGTGKPSQVNESVREKQFRNNQKESLAQQLRDQKLYKEKLKEEELEREVGEREIGIRA